MMILTVNTYTMNQPHCCILTPQTPHFSDQCKPCILLFAMPCWSSCTWTQDSVPNPDVHCLQLTPSNLCWLGKTWEGDTPKPSQRFSSVWQYPCWLDPCQWLPFWYSNSSSTCTHWICTYTILCACTIPSNSPPLLATLHQQIYAYAPCQTSGHFCNITWPTETKQPAKCPVSFQTTCHPTALEKTTWSNPPCFKMLAH